MDGVRHLLPDRVGGLTAVVSVTPTITAGAYHANDVIGGAEKLAAAVRKPVYTAILNSLVVTDRANQKALLDIWLFSILPTGTYTDNGAPTVSAADFAKLIGHVQIAVTDYTSIDSKAVACLRGLGLALQGAGAGSKDLYAVITTTGTPTYSSTSDLTLQFGFVQD